jgi:hypothetical protein
VGEWVSGLTSREISRCRTTARDLDGDDTSSSAVCDVGDVLAAERTVDAEDDVSAWRLVADAQVQSALLINTVGTDGLVNVPQTVVLGNLAVGLANAGSDEVHAVGGGECKLAVRIVKKVWALVHVDAFVLHVNTTAQGWVNSSVLACDKSVPCIVAHVVGTSRLVDMEEVERTASMANLNTHIVTADANGPVGDSVGVDLAAEDANA